MFDIGWSEMAVVALLALLVIGPKDLPKVMRTAAHWVRKARSVTREFQSGVDDMIREAELEDAKKSLQAVSGGDFKKTITDTIDPTGSVGQTMSQVERDARGETATPSLGAGADDTTQKVSVTRTDAKIAPAHSVVPPEDTFRKTADSGDMPAVAEAGESDEAPVDDTPPQSVDETEDAATESAKESAKA